MGPISVQPWVACLQAVTLPTLLLLGLLCHLQHAPWKGTLSSGEDGLRVARPRRPPQLPSRVCLSLSPWL